MIMLIWAFDVRNLNFVDMSNNGVDQSARLGSKIAKIAK